MTTSLSQTANVEKSMHLLKGWLAPRLAPEAAAWLTAQMATIVSGEKPMQLAMAIGLAPRKVGKADLDLKPDEAEAGRAARSGLDATGWSVDQAVRILLVLAGYRGDDDRFVAGLDRILAAAEIGEQIALLRGLPLYPAPEKLLHRAAEGVRSAMQPIFEAVAHRNPYPREQFSEAQWNQMVVKALFIESRLWPIQGLDARRNPDLARMLIDYAAERRAAGRSISPELWRCVAPFAGEAEVEALAHILRTGTDAERKGAALALKDCPLPSARAALETDKALADAIDAGRVAWDRIA
ncbi:MAG TPA: EboA domain-containing protein [Hyphomicrobium sp.]|nr:EboA domain-containing protein [Hyphomicrobium sp.]